MKWDTVLVELSTYGWQTQGVAPATALFRLLEKHTSWAVTSASGSLHVVCSACGEPWDDETGCPVYREVASAIEEFSAVPGCWCFTCEQRRKESNLRITGDYFEYMQRRFIVCPDCGNKRCNRASYHRYKCTGTNDPAQPKPEMIDT